MTDRSTDRTGRTGRNSAGPRSSGGYSGARNTRNGSGSRSSYPNSAYLRRKKRLQQERNKRIGIMTLMAVLIVLLGIFGIRSLKKHKNDKGPEQESAAAVSTEETEAEPESELRKSILVNDIDIAGLSKSEARAEVLKKYSWGVTAVLDGQADDSYAVSNLLEAKLNKVLSEIYSGDEAKDSYELDSSGMDGEIEAETLAMASKWDMEPKNGAVSGYNKEARAFSYTDSVDGRSIDREKLASALKTAMDDRNYSQKITVPYTTVPAELNAAQAKEAYKVIGTFTTKTTGNEDRNNNIRLACAAVDGMILQVGEEFSFNHTTGNRTEEKGYKPAGAYQDGKLVLEPGGGVCQVSSTLYNALVRAGLTAVERHAHTFEPSYVTPGEDATVSYDGYDGPDMRFINTTESSIALRATYYDRTVTCSIIGLPLLEDGVTVTMKSSKTEEFDTTSIEYVEDQTLQLTEEKVIDEGTKGSRWVTNLVTMKDGEVVSNVFLHNSTYKGHSIKIARNTSGIVVPAAGTEEVTIVENTETIPEQGGEIATEAVQVQPGAAIGPAGASQTEIGPGAPSVTESTTAAAPQTEASSVVPAAPAAPVAETTAAPVEQPGSPITPGGSGGPGSGSTETVAPFPGA